MASLRGRLEADELQIGAIVTLPDLRLAELTAESADFICIDLDHGAVDVAHVQPLAIAARAAGAAVLVRLPVHDQGRLDAVLDAGVEGVVAARIDSGTRAAELVSRLRYPPAGTRGFAARRTSDGGGLPATAVLCLVQIESPVAVDHACEIAEVDGVDGLVIDCANLSLSLGDEPTAVTPALVDAVAAVQQAAAAAGVSTGIAGPADPAELAALGAGRSTLVVASADVHTYARAASDSIVLLRWELSRVSE